MQRRTQVGQALARAEHASQSELAGLGKPPVRMRRVSQLSGEPQLPEGRERPGAVSERNPAYGGGHGKCDREVGSGLIDSDAARE